MKASKFLSMLLVLLGFSACDSEFPAMYGSPSAQFEVKVTVTDRAKVPIEGIEVKVKHSYSPVTYLTDAFGVANIDERSYPDSLRLAITDVRDTPAIKYRDTVCRYQVLATDYIEKADDPWFEGVVTKDVTIELRERE